MSAFSGKAGTGVVVTTSVEPESGGVVVPFPGASRAPAVAPEGELEPAPEVVEGELLTDEESAALDRRRGLQRLVPLRVVVLVIRVREAEQTAKARTAAAYRLRQSPRDIARLTVFAVRGNARWIEKGWTYMTHGDLRADARAARLARDAEARRSAQEAIRHDSRERWRRVAKVLRIGLATSVVVIVIAAVLVTIDSQVAREDMWPWLAAVYSTLDALGWTLSWLLTLAPVVWLGAAIWEGRDRTPGSSFLVAPAREEADSWIDERMVSKALAHLGIGPLDKYFKSGGQLVYTAPCRLDGEGTYTQIRLPMGVTAEMVAGKRNTLAGNLGRAPLETWPTQGDEAGILDLWIADKGKLGAGAGVWPLQHDGAADVFEGVPLGKSQRGSVITAPLFEANYLIGGRPGQGKSAAMRTLLLGAALDPTAELWVFVMGQSPDFKPFEPRLSRYAMGMDDSVAEAAVQALTDLLKEMERRGKVLEGLPGSPPKTSRKLANRPDLGLHWIGCAIDECHELFMHPRFGRDAAELAIRLIKRGRKYGISLILATQSPTKDSIPRDVTRNVSCGMAFSVGDHVANDGLLGGGKYKAGIRATDLRMKTDRGTCVAVGLTDATFELLGTFYVPFEDDLDMVTPVINRAMAEIGELRRTGSGRIAIEDSPDWDFLADLAEVIGTERQVRTQVVLTRLAESDRGRYEGWTFGELSAALDEEGIRPRKSDGVMVVRSSDVAQALSDRDSEE